MGSMLLFAAVLSATCGLLWIIHETDHPLNDQPPTGAQPQGETMPNDTETRSARLRAYRHAAGLRIAAVAAELETTTDTVYRWEQGRHVPDVATLDRLAALYGTTPGRLLDGPGPE